MQSINPHFTRIQSHYNRVINKVNNCDKSRFYESLNSILLVLPPVSKEIKENIQHYSAMSLYVELFGFFTSCYPVRTRRKQKLLLELSKHIILRFHVPHSPTIFRELFFKHFVHFPFVTCSSCKTKTCSRCGDVQHDGLDCMGWMREKSLQSKKNERESIDWKLHHWYS
jgi:hypothetical protein